MFDSVEIRVVKNGYIVVINGDDDVEEHVFDTPRKTTKFVRDLINTQAAEPKE